MDNKTKSTDPIYSVSTEILDRENKCHYNTPYGINPFGLTKREHFASMAMQGYLTNNDKGTYITMDDAIKFMAELSVKQADALINALNKKQ